MHIASRLSNSQIDRRAIASKLRPADEIPTARAANRSSPDSAPEDEPRLFADRRVKQTARFRPPTLISHLLRPWSLTPGEHLGDKDRRC